ncbi:MAG TPA: glycosyltransferase family 39 protein [Actinoplanes sp.]
MTTLMERPPAVEAARHAAPARQRRWPVLILLAATALLYLWNLSASGWGNSFYAAAAQAGAQSWKAWLFGSLDAGNAITVDKPPAAMWVIGLSARLFGVNSWSILAPQALMGVASVYLLYLSVKRWFGMGAGLFAGAALALTPVAVLMFRFDNPDALLVLLMTAAAYATIRAVEVASARWLALTGVLLGFGFLTKMMQAFLVLPAMALVYLVAAPTGLGRRVRHLLLAGVALVVSAGWYVALVALWPASSRPYIAGSTNNSLWELAIGYNGLGRILGGSGNGGGGGGGGSSFGGATGIGRLFGTAMGTEISWLLPAALVALVATLAVTWTAPRTDRARAAMLLWGGWLLVTGVTFSYMSGTIHPYYTVALAPAVAAVVAIGARVLWLSKVRWVPAAMVIGTAVWSFVLLGRTDWLPPLRWATLVLGVVCGLALLIPLRRLTMVALIAAVLSAGAGSAAFGAATATVAHSGSIPSSGPSSAAGLGGGFSGTRRDSGNSTTAPGGPMGGSTSNSDLTALLKASTTKWSAAVSGATSAADLELSSGTSVIDLGGWNGGDPSPTLAEFQKDVTAGQIHYYISGAGMGGGGGMGGTTTQSSEIATWVAAHYTAKTVGSSTVYDLTQPRSS